MRARICSRDLGGDRPAALRAVALADAGVEDAQVVVNLGDGADGRARVAAGRLLLDADGRRQAAEVIDVGLLQLAEELPGVAGQRLDVAALPLGVERVEGQRALARAADAGEDDELIARQFEIDVAEVVLAGAADDDGAVVHNDEAADPGAKGMRQVISIRMLRTRIKRTPKTGQGRGIFSLRGSAFGNQPCTTSPTADRE